MQHLDVDREFAGSIPDSYQRYLVPLIFEPFAIDIAARAALRRPTRVLEIAAGAGVVTRHLARVLPADVPIIATDLHGPMLEQAAAQQMARAVEWQQADATQLPFGDGKFDLVVAQFGAMFFPDRPKAYSEALRVLQPGGTFLFNVWDRIEENEFAQSVTQALAELFPQDPPRFLARMPYGYSDLTLIAKDLARAGFERLPQVHTVPARARAESPRTAALAYCCGFPLRLEIEARDPGRLDHAIDTAAAAIARRFGSGPVNGRIQAHVIAAER